jgi:hypothetical protein
VGFDQYHEPANELPAETRTFARLCASLTEEAEAIGWYEQRLALEPDREAQAIMRRKIMIASLRYLDTFSKLDGSWYFAERKLILDWSETRSMTDH